MQTLVHDAGALARAAEEGRLQFRADAGKHAGDFRKIVEGMNGTTEMFAGILNRMIDHIEHLGQGVVDSAITHAYKGEYIRLKEGFNRSFVAVKLLIADVTMLSEAAVAGRLSIRADALNHTGDFKKIVEGVNGTLDAVIRPIEDGAQALRRMAEGDLTVRVAGNYQGDHRKIVESINTVAGSLEEAMRGVSEAVHATASASSQISSSTEEMAAGAHEQMSQANEVAASVEEMTRTIGETSRNARHTSETAEKAKETAEQGAHVVEESVAGMKRIADAVHTSAEIVKALGNSSTQIGEIIEVIDDIADQTNLLALNAAIEAARAGEQGRGFAVVADEVRQLAERTSKATNEIARMITTIQADTKEAVSSMTNATVRAKEGITLADQAGDSLKNIVTMIQGLTALMSDIASASAQQSSVSEQISKNVEAISSVTQQSATGTQQIARAAEDLNRLTERLQQEVARFTLSGKAPQIGSDIRHNGMEHLQPKGVDDARSHLAASTTGALCDLGEE